MGQIANQPSDTAIVRLRSGDPAGMLAVAAAQIDAALADPAIRALALEGLDALPGDGAAWDGSADAALDALVRTLRAADKPVAAHLSGRIGEAGLALALAAGRRTAGDAVSLRTASVALGLAPPAALTVLLPRQVGPADALDLLLGSRSWDLPRAIEAGLFDDPRRARETDIEPILDEAARTAAKRQRGRRAPVATIGLIRETIGLAIEPALESASRARDLSRNAPEAQALAHLARAERSVAAGIDAPARPVRRVAVVGIGTMGRGIVQALAAGGIEAIAIARSDAALDAARTAGETVLAKLAPGEARRRRDRVRWTTDMAAVGEADLVIESIGEEMAAKAALFAALGERTRPGTILASNTSYLDIDALARASGRPADVAGLHFFNPAHIMRLVEIVVGRETAPETVATLATLSARLGKIAVRSGVCDGFIVNRLLAKRSREAYFLIEEGASPYDVDRVLTEFGFPLGPFALGDLAGIDVQHAARRARADRLTPRERRADFVDQLFALGRLGRRSGRGWYVYPEGGRPRPDPEIEALLRDHAARHGIAPRAFDDAEIRDRLLLAMVNEGAALIDEGIVAGPAEIDVALVHGVGFPAHLGGPLWWADGRSLGGIAETVRRHAREQGEAYWRPAIGLIDRAATGRGFYEKES